MVAAAVAAAALACTPQPGLGTLTYTRGGAQHILDLATCRERLRPPARPGPRALVSPDGRLTAGVRISGGRQTIRTGGKSVLSLPRWSPNTKNGSPGPIMLLGWSGDSKWIFYAVDPMGSASIVADGVQMQAVSMSGTVRAVAPTLAYDDYRTWCDGRLVLTAGGDRIAAHHKRLVTVAPPTWRPKALVSAPGRAWGSVTCARTELTSPPPGYSDDSPRFSQDGRTLFFVRSRTGVGKLYALRGGRLLGPLASLGFQLGYYGHHAWPYSVRR